MVNKAHWQNMQGQGLSDPSAQSATTTSNPNQSDDTRDLKTAVQAMSQAVTAMMNMSQVNNNMSTLETFS